MDIIVVIIIFNVAGTETPAAAARRARFVLPRFFLFSLLAVAGIRILYDGHGEDFFRDFKTSRTL